MTTKVEQLGEAAVAIGILDNVKQAYRFLAENYEPEDQVFLFGFSRGAYTLRLLVTYLRHIGLIDAQKLKDQSIEAVIHQGFGLYHSSIHPDQNAAVQAFRHEFCDDSDVRGLIHFLGLWDTVRGSVLDQVREDGKLSSIVKIARHALAIDEQRALFKPELWLKSEHTDSQQMWFAGVHSDIGGGYDYKVCDRDLANMTFHWMLQEAAQAGLRIERSADLIEKSQALGAQHDSLADFITKSIRYSSTSCYLRPLVQTMLDERLHTSVLERYGQLVQIIHGEDKNAWDLRQRSTAVARAAPQT